MPLYVYTKAIADQADHFPVFCSLLKNIAYIFNVLTKLSVRMITADAILLSEIQCQTMDIMLIL